MFSNVLCVFLVVLGLPSGFTFKPCITPHGFLGACIGITHCDSINQLYKKSEELKQHEIEFLKLSHDSCATKYFVCCQVANSENEIANAVRAKRSPYPQTPMSKNTTDFPFPENCGAYSYSDRIINGMVTAIDEYPWMALLKYNTAQGVGYGCAGALINKRYILTAAHCVVGQHGEPVEITLGEYDINKDRDCQNYGDTMDCADPPQHIPIEEVLKHEEYVKDGNRHHDIALIRLSSDAKFSDFVKPICVPEEIQFKKVVTPTASLDVCGWGRTKLKRHGSNVKRKASVPVVDRDTCSKNRTMKIIESQICAGGLKQDTCTGDSGGPLMGLYGSEQDVRYYVFGIVSYGPRECATPGVASVYTNVLSYRDWIIKSIRP